MRIPYFLLFVLTACSDVPADSDSGLATTLPTNTPTTTSTGGTTSTTTTSSTSTTSTTAVDCNAIPQGPVVGTGLLGLFPAEDFAFDDLGNLISHHENALFQQTYPPVTATAFAATPGGPGGPASLRRLHDGDYVNANVDTATLYRISASGVSTPLNSALGYPGGIDIHATGAIFLTDLIGLMRIDPVSGDTDFLLPGDTFSGANGLTFSADYSLMYVGTRDGVMAVSVDADGTPTADPYLFAESPMGGELLGMGVDACDNVYALWNGEVLIRWPVTGGASEVLFTAPAGAWLSNLQWGSGVGGWDAHSIYITDRQIGGGGYYEVPVGVPAKPMIP